MKKKIVKSCENCIKKDKCKLWHKDILSSTRCTEFKPKPESKVEIEIYRGYNNAVYINNSFLNHGHYHNFDKLRKLIPKGSIRKFILTEVK